MKGKERRLGAIILILVVAIGWLSVTALGYLAFLIIRPHFEAITSFMTTLYFRYYVAMALMIACGVPAVSISIKERRKNAIDNSLPRLFDNLAMSQETGMTLLQALEQESKLKGPLAKELRRLVAQVSWGSNFERAFNSLAKRVGTDMASKTITLLIEGMRLGGDLKTTFKSTANFVRRMLELEKEKVGQIRPYFMVIYAATVIFLAIVVLLYRSFSITATMGGGKSLMKVPMTVEAYKAAVFDMAIIEGFFNGLIAGKMGEGKLLAGLKHAAVLLLVVVIVFLLFV